MESINPYLDPLTRGWLPPAGQDFLDRGGWLLVLALGVLLVLLVLAQLLRVLWRSLVGRRTDTRDWDARQVIDLAQCPVHVLPPQGRRLTVYHLPVRLRLVVLAPLGKEGEIDALAVEPLLNGVVPGLGGIAQEDRPWVRVWPAQFSQQGFAATFHRRTRKPEAEGQPSRWVLLAGRAQVGQRPILLGLGVFADEPNLLGRLTLEPHQWLDLVRIRQEGG